MAKVIVRHDILNYFINNILVYQHSMLVKKNPSNFRQHIFCALVAEQNIILEDINLNSNPPGLRPEESRFLQLV
jgi:hypothetical protein